MRRLTVFLMTSLAVACTDAEKVDSGVADDPGDSGVTDSEDSGEGVDSGDTAASADPGCVLAHVDGLVLDRTGGDSLSLVLHCEDATAVDGAEVRLPDLDVTVSVSGAAESDGTTWKGKSLSELEELVAEKGLAFGMDVSHYDLDGELRVVPPATDVVDAVRFHDSHADFSDTVTDGRGQLTGFGLDIAQVVVQQIDRDTGVVDHDGDGTAEDVHVWAASVAHDVGAGMLSVGLDVCGLDAESTCSPAAVATLPFDPTAAPDGHAHYGSDPGYRLPLLAVEHTVGKQEAAFGATTLTSTGVAVQVVRHTAAGTDVGPQVALEAADLGLSAGAGVHVAALHSAYTFGAASAREAVGTLTLAGVGEAARTGEVVVWGAKVAAGGTKPEGVWNSKLTAATAFPAATQLIAGMGTEVLVFFTQSDDGALTATSYHAKSGEVLGTLELDDVSGPFLAVDSAPADFDGDGTPELVVHAVDEDGVLYTAHGELSARYGFAKADVYTPWGDGRAPTTPPTIEVGDDFEFESSIDELDVYIVSRSGRAVDGGPVWATGWTVERDNTEALGKPPIVQDVLAVDATAALVAPGGDSCGDTAKGFCGLVLAQTEPGDTGAVVSGDAVSVVSTTWAGEATRGIPVVQTEGFVVVLEGGVFVVYDAAGNRLGDPLPFDPNVPVSAAERGGELVVFGGTGDVEGRSVATGDLAIVWVDRDGGQGTAVLRSADEFQIPEKVVMEKDGDFYGRSSGDGSHGITLTYSAASRGDVGGWSSILHYGRVVVDEPPGAGETIELDPADFPTVGSASAETDDLADGAYGLKHPLSPGMPLGPGPVMMRKGRAKKRPVAPDPRYGGMRPVGDLTGVTTVADWTAESETDDLLAVVPMETGTACPLATVLVPGTSLDSAANVAGTVVLATSDREDCADLAVPVGALDIDGEGAEWAVLAQADPDAGTTRLRELVWDGEAWLLLPGVTLPVATLSAVNTGDLDGDGVQDLLLDLPADGDRPATRLSLHTRGRSLAPLDATGTDFAAAPSISEDTLAEAIAALDPTVDLDGLDSVRHGLTAADEPWFVVTDDLAGQWILGLCYGGNTALASCGWSRDEAAAYQGRGRRRAKHLRTWESIL